MPGGNVVTWGAQSVRAVVFSGEFDAERADELYLQAFEKQPSGYQSAPPNVPFGSSHATGYEKVGLLQLQKNPGRVDLFIAPSPPPQNSQQRDVQVLNDLGGALDLIVRASTALGKTIANASRLALIIDLAKSANDNLHANRILEEILPISLPSEEVSDFTLQYAKRYNSASLQDLRINILYRWSVLLVQQFFLPAFGASGTPVQTSPSFFAASFVLDVNTVAEITQIGPDRVQTIFREMREKIDEVRRGGPIG